MGATSRSGWQSWFDKDGRNGFQAFCHVFQNRFNLRSEAWGKEEGEPAFPFEGVHQWVTFDRTWLTLYLNLADGGGFWSSASGAFEEKFAHQYEAFAGDGASKYSSHTPGENPDYTDGLFVAADVFSSASGAYGTVVQHTDGNNYVGCWILQHTDGTRWEFRRMVAGGTYSVTGGVQRLGFAQRIGGLWDKSDMYVYVDGVAHVGHATAGAQNTNTTPMNVGVRYRPDTLYSAYYDGWVDNVIIGSGVGVDVFQGRP